MRLLAKPKTSPILDTSSIAILELQPYRARAQARNKERRSTRIYSGCSIFVRDVVREQCQFPCTGSPKRNSCADGTQFVTRSFSNYGSSFDTPVHLVCVIGVCCHSHLVPVANLK